jgi:alkylhydroperoxidase family enzyme
MSRFRLYSRHNAPTRGAAAYLHAIERSRGLVPKLVAALAESEPALRAYGELSRRYAASALTPLERQVVMMTTTRLNAAAYCMAGHSAIAESLGLPREELLALRDGRALVDARLEALRRFTETAFYCRGRIDGATWNAFDAAGYGNAHALEVLVGIALKVFSNFASRMIAVPPDERFAAWSWTDAGAR